ncbi:MAG: hypothetical protein WB611_08175 [Stellaceae bacterium]
MVVAAVEKVPALKNKKGKHGHAVKRQHGFFAGNARIDVAAGSYLLTGGVIKDQQVASGVFLSVASARWQPG